MLPMTPFNTITTRTHTGTTSGDNNAFHNRKRERNPITPAFVTTPRPSKATHEDAVTATTSASDLLRTDESFRSLCKKRFLEQHYCDRNSKNVNNCLAATPMPIALVNRYNIDYQRQMNKLRNVINDELSELQRQQHQTQSEWYSEQQQQQDRTLPTAHHFINDDELYELLIEMEHEEIAESTVQSNACTGIQSLYTTNLNINTIVNNLNSASNGTTTTIGDVCYGNDDNDVMMNDIIEKMYYTNVVQPENDAFQQQIMDYYSDQKK